MRMDYCASGDAMRFDLRVATSIYVLHKWSMYCSPDQSLYASGYRLQLKKQLARYGVRTANLAPDYRLDQ